MCLCRTPLPLPHHDDGGDAHGHGGGARLAHAPHGGVHAPHGGARVPRGGARVRHHRRRHHRGVEPQLL